MDLQKKRLLFSTPKSSLFTVPVSQTLKLLGHTVYIVDHRKFPFYLLINLYLAAALIVYKPHIFLTIKGETIQPWLLGLCRARKILSINWYPDDAFQLARIRRFSKIFDLLFTFDPYIKRILTREGYSNLEYLPFADTPPKKVGATTKKYPLVFIGQYDKTREGYLWSVRDLGLSIWGPWEHTKVRKCVVARHIPQSQVRQVYSEAKIVLNIHSHSFGDERDSLTEGTNLRTFMASGVGAFQLAEYRKDLENLYTLGKELVTFTDAEDLRGKILYYLKHDKRREEIARAAYERTVRDHTYVKRMQQLLAYIE